MDSIVRRLMEARSSEVNELGEPLVPRCTFGKRRQARKLEEDSPPQKIDTYINKADRVPLTRVKNDIKEYPVGTYIRYATKGPINDMSQHTYGLVKVAEDTWVSYSTFAGYGEVESSDSQVLRKMIDKGAKTIGVKLPKTSKTDIEESVDGTTVMHISSKIKSQVVPKIRSYMLTRGYERDEVDQYYRVVTRQDRNGDIAIEVRAELDFEDMMELAELLNPIVEKYGDNAYFDMVDEGIMIAYLSEY